MSKLAQLRKGLGLIQSTAARLVGVDPNTWARWERGEITPSPQAQKKIETLPVLAAAVRELPTSRPELLRLLKQTDAELNEASALLFRYRHDHLALEIPSMRTVVKPGTPMSEVESIREHHAELQRDVEILQARLNQILIRLSFAPEKKGPQ